MHDELSRREVLGATLGALATAHWPVFARAQPAGTPLSVTPIAEDLAVISGAGANITVLQSDNGVLLVDGGPAARAEEILAAVDALTGGKPIEIMFNTNWRPEHTGLNQPLNARGTRIIAHENTRLWMTIPFDVEWEHRSYAERPKSAQPNETFYTSGSLEFGGQTVVYEHYPMAHTDGDICVYLREHNVAAVSDLMTSDTYPIVDYVTGGWIGGLEKALTSIAESTDHATRFVPGLGAVQGRRELEAQLALCTAVREGVKEAYRNGRSVEEFIAARPAATFEAERGDPELFLYLVFKGTWGHVRELGAGII